MLSFLVWLEVTIMQNNYISYFKHEFFSQPQYPRLDSLQLKILWNGKNFGQVFNLLTLNQKYLGLFDRLFFLDNTFSWLKNLENVYYQINSFNTRRDNKVKSNQIKSIQVKSSQVKSSQVKLSQIKSRKVKWNHCTFHKSNLNLIVFIRKKTVWNFFVMSLKLTSKLLSQELNFQIVVTRNVGLYEEKKSCASPDKFELKKYFEIQSKIQKQDKLTCFLLYKNTR